MNPSAPSRRNINRLSAALLLAAAAGLAGCAAPARRAAGAPPLAPEKASQVVLTAMAFIDAPYRRGGTGSNHGAGEASDGFDCSGFTRHVYERSLGLSLPRTAWDQARAPALLEVARVDLQPGDLVFFNTLKRAHSHVGIYIGQGRFVHAPRTGLNVRVEEMQGTQGRYWAERFDGARRATATPP
jgi:cell wall-associated NlpC family hydrolase